MGSRRRQAASRAIPEADYHALDHRTATVAKGNRPTRLDMDSEVRAFLLDRLGTDDVNRIRVSAIERFGPERVPSISAVHRFVMSERAAAGKRKGRR